MARKGSPAKKDENDGRRVVASNRQARRDYEILETIEVGLVLAGSEVKSLREAQVQIADSYARIDDDELWLVGLHIAPYRHISSYVPEPDRKRKLLAHRKEIQRLGSRVDQERLSLVPLSLYFSDGRAKVELGLGRGRRQFDKRQAIAKRDAEMDARRDMARASRGRPN
jgi:SsrA-binding protein